MAIDLEKKVYTLPLPFDCTNDDDIAEILDSDPEGSQAQRCNFLWQNFDCIELLTAPLSIGYGSGEELFDMLSSSTKLDCRQAKTLIDLLNELA